MFPSFFHGREVKAWPTVNWGGLAQREAQEWARPCMIERLTLSLPRKTFSPMCVCPYPAEPWYVPCGGREDTDRFDSISLSLTSHTDFHTSLFGVINLAAIKMNRGSWLTPSGDHGTLEGGVMSSSGKKNWDLIMWNFPGLCISSAPASFQGK